MLVGQAGLLLLGALLALLGPVDRPALAQQPGVAQPPAPPASTTAPAFAPPAGTDGGASVRATPAERGAGPTAVAEPMRVSSTSGPSTPQSSTNPPPAATPGVAPAAGTPPPTTGAADRRGDGPPATATTAPGTSGTPAPAGFATPIGSEAGRSIIAPGAIPIIMGTPGPATPDPVSPTGRATPGGRLVPGTTLFPASAGSPTPDPVTGGAVRRAPSIAPRFSALAVSRARPAPPSWPREPAPIDAHVLDAFLVSRGSPLAGLGAELVNVGWRYNVDPRLLVAIAGADTGFGRSLCTSYNAWNWFWFEWCNSPFESWEQALDEVARGLRVHYLDEGLTDVDLIASRYGPLDDPHDTLGLNRHWPTNVSRYLELLGGSRCNLTWTRTNLACAPPRPTATARPLVGAPVELIEEGIQPINERPALNGPYPAHLADLGAVVPTRRRRTAPTPTRTVAREPDRSERAELVVAAPPVQPIEEPVAPQRAAPEVPPASAAARTEPDSAIGDLIAIALLGLLVVGGLAGRRMARSRRGTTDEGVLS